MKKAIIAGASGLIGSELLRLLLISENVARVTALVRNSLEIVSPKLHQLKVDFEFLSRYENYIEGDVMYCCIGSTTRKTPNKQDYHRIDVVYPVKLAEIAKKTGIHQFHFISALGADHRSRIFYNRIKGEAEEKIKSLQIRSTHIYQPSLLTGGPERAASIGKTSNSGYEIR